MINVIYTLVGQPFRTWVNKLVDLRHETVAEEKQLYIEMDAEVAEVYNNSKAVSTNHGSSFNLMKASSKRRRSKKQIEEEKAEEAMRILNFETKMRKLDEMQDEMNTLRQKNEAYESNVE